MMRSAKPGVMAVLLAVALEAAAQAYRPASLEPFEQVPPRLQHEMDLQALDAFAGKRTARDLRSSERPGPWTLYGRLGLLNFQNALEPDSSGLRFTWRRTGPRLGGRIYVGIHRRF